MQCQQIRAFLNEPCRIVLQLWSYRLELNCPFLCDSSDSLCQKTSKYEFQTKINNKFYKELFRKIIKLFIEIGQLHKIKHMNLGLHLCIPRLTHILGVLPFWFLEKTALHEIRVSGTVLMIQL